MFTLQDIPTEEDLKELMAISPQFDPSTIITLLTLLRLSHDLMSHAESFFTRKGITSGRFMVLMLLLRNQGKGDTPSDLASRAGVTRATMTGLLERLVQDGLVRREQDENDRRSIVMHLTQKGQMFLQGILPEHFQRIATVMSHVNKTDKKSLIELLEKIKTGINEVDRQEKEVCPAQEPSQEYIETNEITKTATRGTS